MVEHIFSASLVWTILAAATYTAAVLCLALRLTPRPGDAPAPERKNFRDAAALCCALCAFCCIPWGALPALCPWRYGGLCAVGLTLCSLALGQRMRSEAPAALFSLAALGVLAWYAQWRGFPGDVFSLDTFVATPVLGNTPLSDFAPQTGGILLLALATLPAHTADARCAGLSAVLRTLALDALWCCLFIPQGVGNAAGVQGCTALALDALYFWLCVLAVFSVGGLLPHDTRWHRGRALAVVAAGALLA